MLLSTVSSSVVTRLSRPRMALAPLLFPWPMPASFAEALLKAKKGEKSVVEPAFVYLPGVPGGEEIQKATGVDYFSVPIELGPNGVEKAINILPKANDYEKKLLDEAIKGLKGNIESGVNFVKSPPS